MDFTEKTHSALLRRGVGFPGINLWFLFDWPAVGFGARSLKIVFKCCNHLGMVFCDILPLTQVCLEIVKLQWCVSLRPYSLPIARPQCLLEPALMKFPIQKCMIVSLRFADQ